MALRCMVLRKRTRYFVNGMGAPGALGALYAVYVRRLLLGAYGHWC